jgi:hypothetical protein
MYIKANKEGIKKASGKDWRLIYNGINVINLFESEFDSYTGGDTQVFVTDTKEKAEAEIKKLGLIIPDHLKNN